VLPFNSPSRTKLSAVATMDCSFDQRRPARHALGLFVDGVLHFAEVGQDLLHRRITHRGDTHRPLAMSRIDMKPPATARNRSPLPEGESWQARNQPRPHSFPKQPDVTLSGQKISGSCPPRITSHNSRLTTRRSPVTTSLPTSANRAPPRGPVFLCACPHQMRTGLERVESRLSECYLRCNELASGPNWWIRSRIPRRPTPEL
jgi:hypothetical protein